ncbi:hypothetical protein DFS34DRAFT_617799 [Phlyctochytrium arcticum]|nr:hypothetical protein DFS34DRAFT_617799 [Phlyctochytrium arcticum]
MNNDQLTTGALQAVFAGQGDIPAHQICPNPVLQVLNTKKIQQEKSNVERWRLLVSDGSNYMQAMIATQFNDKIVTGEIKKGGIIKLKHYVCNSVGAKRIIIVLDIEVLTPHADNIAKIGIPTGLGLGEGPANPVAATNGNDATGQQHQQQGAQQQSFGGANNMSRPTPQNNGMNQQSGDGQQQQQGMGQQGGFGQQQQGFGQQQQQNQGFGANNNNNNNSGYGGNMPPRGGHDAPAAIFPIKSLSPYQNKWTIKARVTQKSDIKTWDNARGSGRLFRCTLVDESGEIRATGFNDAVTAHYDLLENNKVFYISKAAIKVAKKQFNTVNNEYEMNFEPSTTVTPCMDTQDVPLMKYSFVDLNRLYEIEAGSTIDVIGVAKNICDISEIVSKTTQKPFKKRDMTILDPKGFEVRLTLFGAHAENFNTSEPNPVVAVKGVKVGDYDGRSLTAMSGSSVETNPDIPESHSLRGWYDSEGKNVATQSYNPGGAGAGGGRMDPMKLVSQIKDENLGMNEKPDYFKIRGTVMYIRTENPWYPACPTEKCNKKVVEIGNGWRCEKCDRVYPNPSYRYILSITVSDHSGQVWLQAFNETAEILLGKTADEMVQIKDANQDDYDALCAAANFKSYTFKIRAKAETYQDEQKVGLSVVDTKPIDYAAVAHEMEEMIEQYKGLSVKAEGF